MNKLWIKLIDESPLDCDSELFYKWLIDSCETDEDDDASDIWNVKEIGTLFSEKLGAGGNDFSSLTIDGFLCIKSYFLLENEAEKKLSKFVVKQDRLKIGGFSNFGILAASSLTWDTPRRLVEEPKDEVKFKIYSEIKDLDGI